MFYKKKIVTIMETRKNISAAEQKFMKKLRNGMLSAKEQMEIFKLDNPEKAFLKYIEASNEIDENFLQKEELNDLVLLAILEKPYAPSVILAYVKETLIFDENMLLKFLTLPNAGEIMLEHVKNRIDMGADIKGFSEDVELEIFKLPNAEEILLEYIKDFELSGESQFKVFSLKHADKIMLAYVKQHGGNRLSAEAKNLIKGLPNAKEIMAAI